MKRFFHFIFFLIISCKMFSQQTTQVYFDFATKEKREKLHTELINSISQYLSEPLADSTEGAWNQAFWAIEILLYHSDFVKQKLTEAWNKVDSTSEYFQKNLLEVCYTNYPGTFIQQARKLMQTTASIPVFLRCAEYSLQHDKSAAAINSIHSLIQKNFSDKVHIGLTILQNRLSSANKQQALPSLKDIFSKDFLANETVIYSLQRKNRDYPGIVIIRKPDGQFVRNKNGSLFHVSQLARAITNYPFYITNGNTPQGILRWTGFDVSENLYIGPTPNLQMVLPYEAPPFIYFSDTGLVNTAWSKDLYASILPQSWKNYEGIYESFYAGAMGRYAIIMHGTTINPAYYSSKPYYPQTPSLGCLCSYEEWNSEGLRVKSNQQQIADALDNIGAGEGYVVVIELNDLQKKVSAEEIEPLILSAENANKTTLH